MGSSSLLETAVSGARHPSQEKHGNWCTDNCLNLSYCGDLGSILWWGRSSEKETATCSSILTGESHRHRCLMGCSPWGRMSQDMIEWLTTSLEIILAQNKWRNHFSGNSLLNLAGAENLLLPSLKAVPPGAGVDQAGGPASPFSPDTPSSGRGSHQGFSISPASSAESPFLAVNI